jgi:hypothetical protein
MEGRTGGNGGDLVALYNQYEGDMKQTTYDSVAEFPMIPPLTTDSTPAIWHPRDGVMVLATDTQVGVYQRDGDQYVLRGTVACTKQ